MADRQSSLLRQLELAVVDNQTPLSDVLQRCLLLGDDVGVRELKEWAVKQQTGYDPQEEIPAYRTVDAPLMADVSFQAAGRNPFYKISRVDLPEQVRDKIREEFAFIQSVNRLETLLDECDLEGRIRMGFEGGELIVRLMNTTGVGAGWPRPTYHQMFRCVRQSDVRGVLAAIRNDLTALIGGLAANLPPEEDAPAQTGADRLTNIVHFNGNPTGVTVNNAQATGGSTSTATVNPSKQDAEPASKERRRTRVWKWTVDASVVIAGVCAVLALVIGWLTYKHGG